MATLTLEDFLESERHKLTGTLTPVTEETFAKWKKGRMDKKQAEEEAKAMKEATGRAMFEKGDWQDSDGDSDDEDADGTWNLEALRRETEAARQRKEEERLAKAQGNPGGGVTPRNGVQSGVDTPIKTPVEDGEVS
jgi:hypothetical protein